MLDSEERRTISPRSRVVSAQTITKPILWQTPAGLKHLLDRIPDRDIMIEAIKRRKAQPELWSALEDQESDQSEYASGGEAGDDEAHGHGSRPF